MSKNAQQDLLDSHGEGADSMGESCQVTDSDGGGVKNRGHYQVTSSEEAEEGEHSGQKEQRDPTFQTSRNNARSGDRKKGRSNDPRSYRSSASSARAANAALDIEKPPMRYDPPNWSDSPPVTNTPVTNTSYINLYGGTLTPAYVFGAAPGSAEAAAQTAAAELKRIEERQQFLAECTRYGDTEAGMFKAFQTISNTGRDDIMEIWRRGQREEERRKKISESKTGSKYTLRKRDEGDEGGEEDEDYEHPKPKRGAGRSKKRTQQTQSMDS